MRPIRVLLLAAVALLPVLPAAAVPPVPAVTTSFVLETPAGVQQVLLTALREEGGDVLLVRTEDCRRGSCGDSRQERVALEPGALLLEQDRAELTATVAGRSIAASWTASPHAFTVSSGRVQSDGASDSTSADGFAGRSAAVSLQVDVDACEVTGGIGSAFSQRFGSSREPESVALSVGPLQCGTAG